jgi:hypothetical protein
VKTTMQMLANSGLNIELRSFLLVFISVISLNLCSASSPGVGADAHVAGVPYLLTRKYAPKVAKLFRASLVVCSLLLL